MTYIDKYMLIFGNGLRLHYRRPKNIKINSIQYAHLNASPFSLSSQVKVENESNLYVTKVKGSIAK